MKHSEKDKKVHLAHARRTGTVKTVAMIPCISLVMHWRIWAFEVG